MPPSRAARCGLAALFVGAGASIASGQSAPHAPMLVGWADALRLVDGHPRLAAGLAQVAAARGALRAAGAAPSPTLEASLGQGRARDGVSARLEWGLSLSVPLGWLAQRRARRDAAEAELEGARGEASAIRREALIQLGALYWNLVHDQARVAALEALQGESAALARVVGLRVQRGEARPIETPRIELELEKVGAELEAARTSVGARRRQLGAWLRVPAGRTLSASADLSAAPAPIDLAKVRAATRAHHPLVAVARARVRALEAELRTEKLARVPPFALSGFVSEELDRRAIGGGLSVELPLSSWRPGKLAQARARLVAGQRLLEAARLELEHLVIQAEADCRAGAVVAARLRTGVLPRAERSAAAVAKMYRLGEASLLEVIDARRTWLESRLTYLKAAAQAQIDCSRLRAFVGEERP
jgi:cobalt-zinc-cadmium efflux system outer membrane protein